MLLSYLVLVLMLPVLVLMLPWLSGIGSDVVLTPGNFEQNSVGSS